MDNELRKEFRAFKVEVLDRLDRLEAALSAPSDIAAPDTGKSKKLAPEPASVEKDAI
ncbi:hypothetical protein [Rhizobium freirei]|uniref:hypothetical protein n=1 Tax=Rhizobium freirei TaxID=1353277 RepID=UPI0012FC6A44|nr:hypothetical protein [Rhizobium freirei]